MSIGRAILTASTFFSTGLIGGWAASPRLDRHLTPCVWGVEVVDGDTIKCHDRLLRIDGIDTPELEKWVCPAEKTRAVRAKIRFSELMRQRDAIPRPIRFDGGYGRWATRVSVGGKDMGQIMIEEGHAVKRWRNGRKHNWCGLAI